MVLLHKKIAILIIALLAGFTSAYSSCIFAKHVEVKELQIGNMLEWNTIEEQNNEYFAIQRSYDGLEFETIGQVAGAGNSRKEKSYRYLDTSTGQNRLFYRIKQIDFDGKSGQTHTLILHRSTPNNFVIQSMSNTMTNRLFTVSVEAAVKGNCRYQILDMNRKIQLQDDVFFVAGKNTISVNLETLDNGKYFFVLKKGKEIEELLIRKVDPSLVPTINYVIKNE